MVSKAQVESDPLFRALIEHSPDVTVLITSDGTIAYASPSIAHLTGYTCQEVVGMESLSLLHPDDHEHLREHLANLTGQAEEVRCLEHRWRCKDGTWRWIESILTNLLDHPQVRALVCTARDITQRKQLPVLEQAARELLDTEHKFRSLVESNIVGVMVTDQEGRMYEVNDRLLQVLGYSREELLGGTLRVKDLLVPAYRSARARAWKTLLAQGASLPEEKEYVRKDGSIFSALVAAATINQERTRALVILLDMSDRREAERRKEEFLRMVSHELRTPLTAIVGFLELALVCVERLAGTSFPGIGDLLGTLKDMLEQAMRQAEIETRLVAELLDMSRIQAQKFELSLQLCNLATIVQQVVANQQQVIPMRRIELVLPPQASIPVMADADRIEQVLTNYLTNAFKYSSPEQVVWVELSMEKLMARVSVRDQGPGLTEDQQQHIWDRYYQAETGRRQGSNGGLGLGLYIVRTIIAQHQGQVGVESSPGQGATFWFLLPLADGKRQG
jgi:PAS domain S-box-containing protein